MKAVYQVITQLLSLSMQKKKDGEFGFKMLSIFRKKKRGGKVGAKKWTIKQCEKPKYFFQRFRSQNLEPIKQ